MKKITSILIVCILLINCIGIGNIVNAQGIISTQVIKQAITNNNEIIYTFNSPNNPWTSDELATLKTAVDRCYPLIKKVYGNPAFNETVNIVKGTSGLNFYEVNSKSITLVDGVTRLQALCHEMIHSFHSNNIISSAFEEGMTRAAEIEVLNRIPEINSDDKNHSYELDVYYEALNKQSIGGNIFSGYISPFLLYQTSGYAWGKMLLENENFFVNFNNQYYEACKNDINMQSNLEKILNIVEGVQPMVESTPFRSWYERQGSLNLSPKDGKYIFQRINQFTTDIFERKDGVVKMVPGVDIDYSIYDYQNNLLDKQKYTTASNGSLQCYPYALNTMGYSGRIKVVVQSDSLDISDTVFRTFGVSESGVFGVLPYSSTGKLNLVPYDSTFMPIEVNVINGAFSVSSYAAVKGKIHAIYVDGDGQSFSKDFTKDASDYFLFMAPNAPTGISIKEQNGSNVISWGAVNNSQSYNVERSTKIDGDYSIIAKNITQTNYVDTELTPGAVYYYIITANNLGNISNNSETISFAISNITAIASKGRALGTTKVTAEVGQGNHLAIKLSGNPISPPLLYSVMSSGLAYNSGEDIIGVHPSYNKYIGVYEVNSNNQILGFRLLTITNNEFNTTAPILTAVAKDGIVDLSWGAVPGAERYNMYQSLTPGTGYTAIGQVGGTSYSVSGLKNGTTYYFAVEAFEGVVYTPYSNEVIATPQDGNIDRTFPVITINPYTTTPTNKAITVTATTNEGTLNATSHTFTENGSFDFTATDAAGNVTTITVTITNIDLSLRVDFNNDGVIDIKDLALIAKKYNMKSNNALWNGLFDVNSDNIVDIYDLVVVSKWIQQK